MYFWFVASMWLHLLAAIVWIGGLAFISMVLVPTLRAPGLRAQAVLLLRTAGKKFQRVAYASLVTLVVTGALNLVLKAGGSTAAVAALLPTAYGQLLIVKVLLVAAIVGLSLYHDFAVGPAAARAMEAEPAGARAMSLRKRASWLGRVNMLLSLVVMTLALLLVRGVPI
jgi:putative copper resistance protein D